MVFTSTSVAGCFLDGGRVASGWAGGVAGGRRWVDGGREWVASLSLSPSFSLSDCRRLDPILPPQRGTETARGVGCLPACLLACLPACHPLAHSESGIIGGVREKERERDGVRIPLQAHIAE